MNNPPLQKQTPSPNFKEVLDTVHGLALRADNKNELEELVRGLCLDLAKNIKELRNEKKDC